MKSILLSIKPKYVAKILNGEKTIEVRKRFPEEYKGWVYIYCTKDKTFAHFLDGVQINGRVVARFYCDKVTEYINGGRWNNDNTFGSYDDYIKNNVCGEACITEEELDNYCEDLAFSAIHISQLEIFDEPKELSEFRKWYPVFEKDKKTDVLPDIKITKAPQNYCYVEVE